MPKAAPPCSSKTTAEEEPTATSASATAIGNSSAAPTNTSGAAVISEKPIPALENLHSLHFLPEDPSETKDLSTENPDKLAEMIALLETITAE